jgi:hypothetical protein
MKQKNLSFWDIPLGILAAVAVLALLMCSCKSIEYVPVIEHHTDSVYLTKVQRDSVYSHDSVYIKEKGDTVLIERWHTRYVEKLRIDTTYVAKIDSIPVPYEVTKYVERKLSKAQTALMLIGLIAILAAVVSAVFWVRRIF